MDLDGIAEFLKPRLRLFLSIDLVGSTALKQRGGFPLKEPEQDASLANLGASWFSPIGHFYRDVEKQFFTEWNAYKTRIAPPVNWPANATPELWKSNGDELIYTLEISDPREVYAGVVCWLNTLLHYRAVLAEQKIGLDVKAAAWVAGFPVANSEVIFRYTVQGMPDELGSGMPILLHFYYLNKWYKGGKDREGLIKDFVGPSIDTGFRICGQATARKFAISLEVALLLSMVIPAKDLDDKIVLRYDGKKELKGVLGGRPYPIFWIDTKHDDKLEKLEDSLAPLQVQDTTNVRKFCLEFISKNESHLFQPFIVKAEEPLLKVLPSNYERHLKALNEKWLQEQQRLELELRGTRGEEPQTGDKGIDLDPDGIEDFASGLRVVSPPTGA
ncbi:hypothetical protein ABAZ39_12260 [Azospirillum argentinense]|uniref:Uncharacterized protein n=1 Tax=Azospirillum argentinense TaxID=2970906 RepID=A0A060DNQ1_9PROT|nr:hypothetical protein [Azospirillum argentinense]AIB12748.1 hypothetical protein ABAZ39_12260 [Azospirillum argentinense]EZQ09521.1 hypothetical protein ABAZ39_13685 [Azospirillum argentinense]PNQ94862.1 hypothetical protein C1S70_32050 [Azospirillum argentinense]